MTTAKAVRRASKRISTRRVRARSFAWQRGNHRARKAREAAALEDDSHVL